MPLLDSLPRPHLPRTFRSLVVNRDSPESRWANPDILPVPPRDQTYTWRAYMGYWMAVGANVTVWSIGSSNLANGLDAGAAIGGVFMGGVLCAVVACLCGEPGVSVLSCYPFASRWCGSGSGDRT
jgi:nucleobase:cation symporter-1, NCS1 family